MEDTVRVGVGFRPYEEELVGYFLRHQNEGNTHLVQDFISEVNICSFDPPNLRLQSKIRSRDQYSYFFSRLENKYATGNGNQQSRTTPSGKWKITGVPSDVKDQWGICSGVRGVIGFKRVLSFQKKNTKKGTKSDWVIHEFHNTLLPQSQRNYVLCRLEYKGDDINIILGYPTDPMTNNSPGSVVDQPGQGNAGYFNNVPEVDSANQQAHWWFPTDFDMQQSVQPNSGYFNNFSGLDSANEAMWLTDDNSNLQQQGTYSASYEDESQMLWNAVVEENLEFLVDESRTYMEENFNNHRPKSPVRGVLAGYSSDSDAESMICGDTSSSTDSVGSSSGSWHTPRDDILSLTTLEQSIGGEETPEHIKREDINHEAQDQPEQQKLQLQGKDKVVNLQKTECEWKMAEDSIKRVPLAITVRQSCIVLEEISQRNSKWNYLKNSIIGFLLFFSIIGWIVRLG